MIESKYGKSSADPVLAHHSRAVRRHARVVQRDPPLLSITPHQ